ncbi:aminoglycoside phosphotransferase family protein [Pseudoalteromonas luteoviolacea]|uniref:Aminoglycoside phosphotransferase domain-containing protein n=1 Tax=Pseudoalteromonas luteoviolacea S4054 TaxID=1129367 RepID=A0A0F6A9X3_9GAMM|nr:phosphotransferase [Pseudoalteromonas luteoviolacea]AOT07377.1 hypothetical protein S4054249_05750 [Pseudoalteromonas luteoviolacea]AOT12292.1 hypothetical protein S40542_05750 [Pseudoalteromonas luteoviolacea]AOT17205.1 hypothetical protein S4054_05750 [Pseudoalteromonas luteoviolacea]KKE82997.1 hypothetical protein N479_01425 [Pseudoalteromonas luteoviolacea S4054]KZN72344.1 hypothetical protein N481_15630 [Pseudoalteromonas luteoviolacea S4047-1]
MASLTPAIELKRAQYRTQFVDEQLKRLTDGFDAYSIDAITGDASFRLYFRIQFKQTKYILMDVSPEKGSIEPFVHLNQVFADGGLAVPKILAVDVELGFILLEDLGSVHLADIVAQQDGDDHYQALLSWLPQIAKLSPSKWMNPYDAAFITQEMDIFKFWLLEQWLGYSSTNDFKKNWQQLTILLTESMLRQPQVVMHRDFHSRNVMYCKDQGRLIDYQDAVVGPVCYDAVSLLKDCYIKLPVEQFERLREESFCQLFNAGLLSNMTYEQYIEYFNFTGMQRHLKAAGIFVRLYLRDGKSGYLPNILPTLEYVIEAAQMYPQFQWLATWLHSEIIPMIEEKLAESL